VLALPPGGALPDGPRRAPARIVNWPCHLASPATTLIVVAMITAPMGNDIHACRSAVRRICLDWIPVSETWNVMPTVKDK
jgi:hypothetical protein